jgi:hypothetical protein
VEEGREPVSVVKEKTMTQPKTNVQLKAKAEIMQAMWTPLMNAMANQTPDDDVTGDDLLEFFALGMAMVLDNDTHITTPRQERLAQDTAKTHVIRWMKVLKEVRAGGRRSFLAMCNNPQAGDDISGANDNIFGVVH